MNRPASYSELIISGSSIVRFYDQSSRYFGDYYRVRLEVRCEFDLPDPRKTMPDCLAGEEPLPGPTVFTRMLERMAVPSASVEEVKRALIEDFTNNTLPYLSSPDFPSKMKNAPGKNSVNRKYPASS